VSTSPRPSAPERGPKVAPRPGERLAVIPAERGLGRGKDVVNGLSPLPDDIIGLGRSVCAPERITV
jgi:hypothetical protein